MILRMFQISGGFSRNLSMTSLLGISHKKSAHVWQANGFRSSSLKNINPLPFIQRLFLQNSLMLFMYPCTEHHKIFFTYYYGCKRKFLPLYKSLIHSILDYETSVYIVAINSVLKLLDCNQTHYLRQALGAFCTSSKLSLCTKATKPHLVYPTLILTYKLLASVSQFLYSLIQYIAQS